MTNRPTLLPTLGTLVVALSIPSVASAQYLDPGAGSIIVQALIAGFVAVAAGLKLYWGKISAMLSRKQKDEGSR